MMSNDIFDDLIHCSVADNFPDKVEIVLHDKTLQYIP